MTKLNVSTAVALPMLLLTLGVATRPVVAGDDADTLKKAIHLFEDGQYLAAQEQLTALDRGQLTKEQQTRRDDYLERVQLAINMDEQALRDLEDGETAIGEQEWDRAKELFDRVLANEYAAKSLRSAARIYLRDLATRSAASGNGESRSTLRAEAIRAVTEDQDGSAPPAGDAPQTHEVTPPQVPPPQGAGQPQSSDDVAQARSLTKEGDNLVQAARYEEAKQRYQRALQVVPGFPEAVEGLQRASQHQSNASGSRAESLAERIHRRDAINWQRSVALYRNAEETIRGHLEGQRFDKAHEMLVRARQIVESGKQFADPFAQYETLHHELQALDEEVRRQERVYQERKIAKTREEIIQRRSAKLRRMDENRARQVKALMEQAQQHRKEGELAAAINVLKQVVVIDPSYHPARWLMDELEDRKQYRMQRESRREFYIKSRGALEQVEKAKIPWYEEINYPKDWLELISRPGRARPGESRADRQLFSALNHRIPVDFPRVPFQETMERLAQGQGINILVNWNDLGRAHVDRKTPIELSLPQEITLKKAITEVLEQAGGGKVALGYNVADGVITVATQEFLDKNTYPRVYDIRDLLMKVPDYTNAPTPDLRATTLRSVRPASTSTSDEALPWRFGDDDDDEREENPERDDRVKQVIDLIESVIAPESWREKGGTIGTIKEINGQLVVTQNAAAHGHIVGLLDRLRAERAIQIAVEALFITVSSHYLEEIGIDLDIVLNSASAGFDFIDSGSGPVTDPILGNRLLLPRTFSRLGFTPNTPNLGTALNATGTVNQPFTQPFLVPGVSGGSGSRGTPVPVQSGVLGFTDPANLPSDIPGSFGGQTTPPALSLFGSFLDNIQVDFMLRATQADSRTHVLTAPRLVVFNGASAWIAVTIQQNFISQLQPVVAQGAVAQAPITGTIDAGASLFVRATATADRRYVLMLVSPGVTRLLALQTFNFSGGTGANQAFVQLPTLSAQRVQTMVSVPDGGTLLIGGQKLASETEVEAGVPILSRIPVLKRFYSSRSLVKDEQVLLILIKPKILIQSEQEELAFPSFANGNG